MKYESRKTGLNVITGKVKEVGADSLTLETEVYVKDQKEPQIETITVKTDEVADIKVNYNVTAIGYKAGANTISASKVMNGNDVFERDGICVLNGFLSYAALNEEKDENGNPRLNQENQPRKPHYDLSISVKDGDDSVNHRIRIYNNPNQQDAIEKAGKMFGTLGSVRNVEGKDMETRIFGTFITSPGEEYTTTRNGVTYRNVSHMGLNKQTHEYIQVEVREKEAPAMDEKSSGDGFMNIPDGIDEELPFN